MPGFRSARLTKGRCRDTVALDPGPDSLVIAINDTPNGADLYEFEGVFRPRPRPGYPRVRSLRPGCPAHSIRR